MGSGVHEMKKRRGSSTRLQPKRTEREDRESSKLGALAILSVGSRGLESRRASSSLFHFVLSGPHLGTQGVEGATGKSRRSRGHERKKIGKGSSELQPKRNRDRGSGDLQFWRSLDSLSRFRLGWSSEELFHIFLLSCPPELNKAMLETS